MNIFLNNILHQLTITRGWMCPQNKKISSIGAHYQHCWAPLILSTSKRIESATTFILSKGTTQHFWITMNEWRAKNMKASLQIPMYFQCILLLSAISKNLVVAALKGKTSMVLSPQNWQLDTPEGKLIHQCLEVVGLPSPLLTKGLFAVCAQIYSGWSHLEG